MTESSSPQRSTPPSAGRSAAASGSRTRRASRGSGSYRLPYDINLAGSFIANGGCPYQSTYAVTRFIAAAQGIALTRSSRTVVLSESGDERRDSVQMIDLRLSKTFRFGGSRSFTPQIDFFNITSADTVVNLTSAVGGAYLRPNDILPRGSFAWDSA